MAPPKLAKEAAERTGAYMGFARDQYALLVRRMLGIGMTRLRLRVQVANGVFGVWKEKPQAKKKKGGVGRGA